MATSYTKLRDGSWGLRVQGTPVNPGATLTVTTKAGATKRETVGKVVWSGQGVTLCTIAGKGGTGSVSAAGGKHVCMECGRTGQLVCDLEDGMWKHRGCCDIPPDGY